MNRNWEIYDKLLEELGGDELSLSICKALTSDTMNDVLSYIATAWDITDESEGH